MTENKIKNAKIGGKYTGGNDYSTNTSVHLSEKAVSAFNDQKNLNKFSLNAQKYISGIAEKILETHGVTLQDQGLDFSRLQIKFENVKCTEDYKENYKKQSVYFHEIDQIRNNDAVQGGDITIQCIMVLIHKIYTHLFEKHDNGDMIHSAILQQIIDTEVNAVELIAADILIYYTVNECGIFNERK